MASLCKGHGREAIAHRSLTSQYVALSIANSLHRSINRHSCSDQSIFPYFNSVQLDTIRGLPLSPSISTLRKFKTRRTTTKHACSSI